MDWKKLLLATALAASALAALAEPRRVESAVFELQQTVAGQPLQLNGAGVRKKLFIKVYAAALYTPKPIRQVAQVWDSPGPKRLRVVALREIDASSLGKAMSQTMSDNLPKERMGPCIPGLIKLGDVFAEKKRLAAGESFSLDDIPGQGTVVSINEQQVAVIEGSAFFGCLMYNYFGERPADAALKQALLEPDAGATAK
ncbi:chalcone isomerase family protein [Curvibacter sp. APW13]|uniref:chalcone isomerase family protein n=1 Tax=Curvibacter sp. APW13 TaxID=3077236 RepID=UPI0028E00321|nr:chalcone isomerase family protein [Curvibacter sp. APW13]MDT8990290.1 chalcone isomerase family protein [Curvibacter sp. APW13]